MDAAFSDIDHLGVEEKVDAPGLSHAFDDAGQDVARFDAQFVGRMQDRADIAGQREADIGRSQDAAAGTHFGRQKRVEDAFRLGAAGAHVKAVMHDRQVEAGGGLAPHFGGAPWSGYGIRRAAGR